MSLVNVLGKFGSTVVSKSVFTSTPAKYALTVSPNSSSVNIGGIDYPAVNEGTTVTFELVPNKVNKFNYGAVVPYNITGIEIADLVNSNLTGQFIVGTDMVRTFTIDEDANDDSINEIMTMTVVNPAPTNAVGLSASVYIADSSKAPPSYTLYLSGNGSTTGFVYEDIGTTVTFALKTRGVYHGTQIPYTITGIDINDLDTGSALLQGYFTVSSIITAGWLNDKEFPNPLPEDITYVTFNIKKDGIIEGNETMVITLSSHVDPVRGILTATEGRTAQVIIKDEITWSSWTPELSTVCLGQSLTQTRISNYNITESRLETGTRSPVWSSWTPDLSTVCLGQSFTQTKTDLNGKCVNQTQIVLGTREPVWSPWTPALSTVDVGVTLTQTRVDENMLCNSQTQIVTRDEPGLSSNIALFVRGEGPNDSNNKTFVDSSQNFSTITAVGSPTQGSFGPFPLNGSSYSSTLHGGSGYFNGTTDYLTVPASSNFNFANGTAFTVEFFINPLSLKTGSGYNGFATIISTAKVYPNGWRIEIGPTGIIFYTYSNSAVITTPISLNTWTHIAIVHDGTTTKMYKDGVLSGSAAATWIASTSDLVIGGLMSGPYTYYYNGYISNLRFTKGAVLYPSNFALPTSPLTLLSNGGATPSTAPTSGQVSLLCNFLNGGIIDSTANNDLITLGNIKISTSVKKSGTGSLYFPPASYTSYVTAPPSSLYNLHNNVDFTIECWVNFSGLASRWGSNDYHYILSNSQMALFTFAWAGKRNRKQPHYLYFNIGPNSVPTSFSPAINTWYHIAVTRQSGNLTIWVDGTSQATQTIDNLASSDKYPLNIGNRDANTDPNIFFPGYIDNFKITKGAAVYTAPFTPPLT